MKMGHNILLLLGIDFHIIKYRKIMCCIIRNFMDTQAVPKPELQSEIDGESK